MLINTGGLRYTLPPSRRIKKREEFEAVFKHNKKLSFAAFVAFYMGDRKKRFGFAASAKLPSIAKKNRAKRRLREAVRITQHLFPDNASVIFVANKRCLHMSWDELVRQVAQCAVKLQSIMTGQK